MPQLMRDSVALHLVDLARRVRNFDRRRYRIERIVKQRMCVNAVVGSGVVLLPYESYVLLGPFSLWAPLLFAVPVFILVLCFAEAASYFEEPGGAYLYARAAFGDFVGFQTGWIRLSFQVGASPRQRTTFLRHQDKRPLLVQLPNAEYSRLKETWKLP